MTRKQALEDLFLAVKRRKHRRYVHWLGGQT